MEKSKEIKTTEKVIVNNKTQEFKVGEDHYRRRMMNYKRSHRRRDRLEGTEDLDIKLVSINRVTKVKAGGKTLRIRVLVVVGDRMGKVGVAIAKGKDVKSAQAKAVSRAKKKMIKIVLSGQTIPYEVKKKFGATKLFLKPAVPGTGVICGGAVRSVVETAGIKDILSKVYGSKNTLSCVYATFEALKSLRLLKKSNETK